MLTTKTKKAMAAALAVTTLGAGMLSGSVSADPANETAFVGVGSDTTQDVMNAMAGRSNNLLYTPIQASAANGSTQVISYDATNPDPLGNSCIVMKRGFGTVYRPNGSSEGRRMLSRTLDAIITGYGTAGVCGGVKDVSGMVDFARSSSGPESPQSVVDALRYIPFGQDALSFAYYKPTGASAAVTSLTNVQLAAIFGSATRTVINGVTIIPCGIQDGSGTFKFWNKAITGAETSFDSAATAQCNASVPAGTTFGRAQESDGPALSLRGDNLVPILAGLATPITDFQVVIGFSAGAYIAKTNGVATPHPKAGIDQVFGGTNAADDKQVLIGGISDVSRNATAGANIGNPISAGLPNATFYANTTFGRKIYNVFPTAIITGPGNNDLKELFVGNTSKICLATTTIATFGFLSLGAGCGDPSAFGNLVSGAK